jgi:hypothetical protein
MVVHLVELPALVRVDRIHAQGDRKRSPDDEFDYAFLFHDPYTSSSKGAFRVPPAEPAGRPNADATIVFPASTPKRAPPLEIPVGRRLTVIAIVDLKHAASKMFVSLVVAPPFAERFIADNFLSSRPGTVTSPFMATAQTDSRDVVTRCMPRQAAPWSYLDRVLI